MQTTTARSSDSQGSHMPLDATVHWVCHNPLNIIPALLLLLALLALVGAVAALI